MACAVPSNPTTQTKGAEGLPVLVPADCLVSHSAASVVISPSCVQVGGGNRETARDHLRYNLTSLDGFRARRSETRRAERGGGVEDDVALAEVSPATGAR